MNRISRWWGVFWVLSALLIANTASAAVQNPKYAVDVSGVKGQIVGLDVQVSGKVTNSLPWTVTHLKVVTIFQGTTTMGTANIDKLDAKKSKKFNMTVKNVAITATKFVTVVGSYDVQSNDVSSLLEKYDESADDIALQAGISQAFTTMTDEALPELLSCIDTTSRTDNPSTLIQETHDLLCLEGIRKVGGSEGAKETVDLLAWYEKQNALDLPEVINSLLVNQYNPISSFPLLQNLKYADINIKILAKMVLVDIGTPSVPALLYASQHSSSLVKQTAQEVLVQLNKTTMDAILIEDDPAILKQIIDYLQEVPRSDAVIPLLLVSHRINKDEISAQIETCILSYGDMAIQPLTEALLSWNLDIVNQAESLLYKLAPGRETLLRTIAASQNIPTNTAEASALVKSLRTAADQRIQASITEEFSKGWEAYQAGDCLSSVEIFQKMFAIRHPLLEYTEQVSQAYACQLKKLASADQVEQATDLTREALGYMPGNEMMNGLLVGYYHTQANGDFKAGDIGKAGELWKQVLVIDPGNKNALQGLGRLNVRLNWLYLAIGGVGVLVLITLSKISFSKDYE